MFPLHAIIVVTTKASKTKAIQYEWEVSILLTNTVIIIQRCVFFRRILPRVGSADPTAWRSSTRLENR